MKTTLFKKEILENIDQKNDFINYLYKFKDLEDKNIKVFLELNQDSGPVLINMIARIKLSIDHYISEAPMGGPDDDWIAKFQSKFNDRECIVNWTEQHDKYILELEKFKDISMLMDLISLILKNDIFSVLPSGDDKFLGHEFNTITEGDWHSDSDITEWVNDDISSEEKALFEDIYEEFDNDPTYASAVPENLLKRYLTWPKEAVERIIVLVDYEEEIVYGKNTASYNTPESLI